MCKSEHNVWILETMFREITLRTANVGTHTRKRKILEKWRKKKRDTSWKMNTVFSELKPPQWQKLYKDWLYRLKKYTTNKISITLIHIAQNTLFTLAHTLDSETYNLILMNFLEKILLIKSSWIMINFHIGKCIFSTNCGYRDI